MKIKILNRTDMELKFLMEELNPQFANALRRIIISEVPILAIDDVDFNANESVLYNEVIAQRLGLIPLVFDPKSFKFKEEGVEKSASEVIFALNKKGPAVVYAKDLKSSNPDVKPLYDDIPIVELFEEQKLKFEASASLGLGKDHAKYQAANAFYKYYPLVKLNGKLKNPNDVMKACPKGALKIEGDKVTVTEDCDACRECVKVAEPKGVLEISGDPTRFIFSVESISGLKTDEIVLLAIDILKKKIKDFGKELGKLK